MKKTILILNRAFLSCYTFRQAGVKNFDPVTTNSSNILHQQAAHDKAAGKKTNRWPMRKP
jgi:hypothetical protein